MSAACYSIFLRGSVGTCQDMAIRVLHLLFAIVATLRHVTKEALSCRCVHTRAMSMRRGRFSESITSIVRPTSYHDCNRSF